MIKEWKKLAARLRITLPAAFMGMLKEKDSHSDLCWRILAAGEALKFQAELYERYPLPDRAWDGIPFALSTVCEDVACFDLTGSSEREAMVLPIRDWNGPRWEYMGDKRTFDQWLGTDREGNLN